MQRAIADRDRRAGRLAELADRNARLERDRQQAEADLAAARTAGDPHAARAARERIEDLQVQLIPVASESEQLRSEQQIAERTVQADARAQLRAAHDVLATDLLDQAVAHFQSLLPAVERAKLMVYAIRAVLDAAGWDRGSHATGPGQTYERGFAHAQLMRRVHAVGSALEELSDEHDLAMFEAAQAEVRAVLEAVIAGDDPT